MTMPNIPDLSPLDVAFGNISALPKYSDLPRDYQSMSAPGCKVASNLFFRGGRMSDFGMKPRDGVDASKARTVIQACLGSFEPKHEHKIGGVGWLIDQWFERAE